MNSINKIYEMNDVVCDFLDMINEKKIDDKASFLSMVCTIVDTWCDTNNESRNEVWELVYNTAKKIEF